MSAHNKECIDKVIYINWSNMPNAIIINTKGENYERFNVK